ncbi:sepiapterin reductase [Piptocephalis cylindrospora]|uniref:Sepiapterin reductase n=1 Tax=Piptocephalis cylindrospora TaxID=1907219 RepID=A0A4P9Y2J8_9FUNG|nr:sepiapterin reductase [Piptocephalis cylindrospora]|eukprot:RKP12904.1 sepiapterin reductase [Piptocephalis cylindrospora]
MPSYLVILTGANGGLGKAIAQSWISLPVSGPISLHLVLVGRSKKALDSLKEELIATQSDFQMELTVSTVSDVDLSQVDELDEHWGRIKRATLNKPYDKQYFILNAGSLGDLSKPISGYTTKSIQTYMDVNVVSTLALTSHFLRHCQETGFKGKGYLINISSLLAIQPFPYWGTYAVGKAARDMIMATVAKEVREDQVRSLSYAPGPLDGLMQEAVRTSLGDLEQQSTYQKMHQEGKLVTCKDSATKLIHLLLEDAFASGSHVDYFDE